METNSGSPLGAICSTVGMATRALREATFFLEAFFTDFLEVFFFALVFTVFLAEAFAAFLPFLGFGAERFFTFLTFAFFDFFFLPAAIGNKSLNTQGIYRAIRWRN